jgi:hypothetical protein
VIGKCEGSGEGVLVCDTVGEGACGGAGVGGWGDGERGGEGVLLCSTTTRSCLNTIWRGTRRSGGEWLRDESPLRYGSGYLSRSGDLYSAFTRWLRSLDLSELIRRLLVCQRGDLPPKVEGR